MKKKIVALLCVVLMGALCSFVFTGCENSAPNSAQKLSTNDVYAISAVSGASYLMSAESGSSASALLAAPAYLREAQASPATARPEVISDEDVAGVKDCLTMFEDILGGGVTESVSDNDDDGEFADYEYVMTVSVVGIPQMKMYYNEVSEHIEDDEISVRLDGVMAIGEARFDVRGEREIETDDGEVETSIKFTTRSRSNPLNYVKVSQSVENDEIGYKYEIYENGRKVQDLEVEIERENGRTELTFSLSDNAASSSADKNKQKTKYKIEKPDNSDTFRIQVAVNGMQDKFTAVRVSNGYEFTYSNGFVETV